MQDLQTFMEQGERLELLIAILNPDDYRFIGAHDFRAEAKFRRDRLKIYRAELRDLAGETLRSYQERLGNMNAAGQWRAYPRLAWSTAATFFALGKLCFAGTLFQFRLPMLINLTAQRDRLEKYFTVG